MTMARSRNVRQQQRRDVGVVLDQVALGNPALRPEQLVEVGEMDFFAADRERDRAGWRNEGHERVLGIGCSGCLGAVSAGGAVLGCWGAGVPVLRVLSVLTGAVLRC